MEEGSFLTHQIRKTVVLAWARNSVFYPGVLTQTNYISAFQFYSTAGTILDKVKGNFSMVLSKKKNPIWGSVVDGRFRLEG